MKNISNLYKSIYLRVAIQYMARDNKKFDVNITNILDLASTWLDICISYLPSEPIEQQLTYKSVITYFVEQAPSVPQVRKGAMLRQFSPKGELTIIQIFLDDQNELVYQSNGKPYGRKLVIQEMDQELINSFGKEDVIIFE